MTFAGHMNAGQDGINDAELAPPADTTGCRPFFSPEIARVRRRFERANHRRADRHDPPAGSGHRRYHRSVLRRIAFIVFAQRIGLTLDEIGTELAKLPADRVPTRRDWAHLSAGWAERIDRKIAELERLRAGLTECIGCGCLSIDRCSLANPEDRAGRNGAGPRYWLA